MQQVQLTLNEHLVDTFGLMFPMREKYLREKIFRLSQSQLLDLLDKINDITELLMLLLLKFGQYFQSFDTMIDRLIEDFDESSRRLYYLAVIWEKRYDVFSQKMVPSEPRARERVKGIIHGRDRSCVFTRMHSDLIQLEIGHIIAYGVTRYNARDGPFFSGLEVLLPTKYVDAIWNFAGYQNVNNELNLILLSPNMHSMFDLGTIFIVPVVDGTNQLKTIFSYYDEPDKHLLTFHVYYPTETQQAFRHTYSTSADQPCVDLIQCMQISGVNGGAAGLLAIQNALTMALRSLDGLAGDVAAQQNLGNFYGPVRMSANQL